MLVGIFLGVDGRGAVCIPIARKGVFTSTIASSVCDEVIEVALSSFLLLLPVVQKSPQLMFR